MDGYPAHLAPELNDDGGVLTPFEEWWPKVRHAFPNVPEEVARYWLHEHWRYSPYGWLPSADYQFQITRWPTKELFNIRSGWCNFSTDSTECYDHGKSLYHDYTVNSAWPYKTVSYMSEHGNFPTPIIILDNCDGHLVSGVPPVPSNEQLPAAFVLVEGHRRFNLALYLQSIGKMRDEVDVWLMTRVNSRSS